MNINNITILELSALINNKEISIKELVQEYINHMKEVDLGINGLNSIIEINPEVMAIAENLDNQKNTNQSMLFGMPILLKDNIDTADKMHTSAGSLALADSIPSSDADVVKVLRSKGAIILGKTNMTEFANYMTKGMPSGYSSRGGQVKSPFKRGEDPSGSSTGSAVAVVTNLCVASLGTDTSDSIVSPAIKNGIVGFRPSMGAISQKGIIPISFTCDTVGPMTRTVMDSTIIFSELTGQKIYEEKKTDYHKLTVGINEWALKNMNGEDGKKASSIIRKLEKAGITIKRLSMEPIPTHKIKSIQRYEFKYSINRYLKELPEAYPIRSLKDIIEFNNEHRDQTLQYGQTLLIDAEDNTKGDLSETEYIALQKDRETNKKHIYEQMRGLDTCIMFRENLLLQYTGMPIITIPHGLYNDGMPYGITLTARSDSELLRHAHGIEQLYKHY